MSDLSSSSYTLRMASRYLPLFHLRRSMSTAVSVEQAGQVKTQPLEVCLTIDLPPGNICPLADVETDQVQQNLSNADEDSTCRTVVTDGNSSEYNSTTVSDSCVCPAFSEFDCIPNLETVNDGSLVVWVTVPDRSSLRPLIDKLRDGGSTVSVNRIHTCGENTDSAELSGKQEEALIAAIRAGYYERPRQATLKDLAAEMGITPSAVSQRLTAVERKLVTEHAQHLIGQ